MHKQVDTLMNKEMSRQEFLKAVGIGLISLFGFSSIVKLMTGIGSTGQHRAVSNGYGSSPYGK